MTSRKVTGQSTKIGKAGIDRSRAPFDGDTDGAVANAKVAERASQPLGAFDPLAVFNEWDSDADHQAYRDL